MSSQLRRRSCPYAFSVRRVVLHADPTVLMLTMTVPGVRKRQISALCVQIFISL